MRRKQNSRPKIIKEQILFIVEGESEKNIIEFLKRKHDIGSYQKINYVLSKELRLSTTEHRGNDYKIDKCIENYSNSVRSFVKVIIWLDSDRFNRNVKDLLGTKVSSHNNVLIFWSIPNLENNFNHCSYLRNSKNKPYIILEKKSSVEKLLQNHTILKITKEIIKKNYN